MLTVAISSASSGIHQNLQRYAAAADRITDPDSNAGIDEIVAMKRAEQGILVNAAVIKTTDKLTGIFVDMIV